MSDDIAPVTEIELDIAPPLPDEVESTPTLVLEGLTKQYGTTLALNDFSYDIRIGAVHAILGDHQAGKSTLLKLLSGFSDPDAGEIRWFGRPVHLHTPGDALALGIGIVHQTPTLIPTLSVGENILLGSAEDGFPQFYRTPYRNIRALADQYGVTVNPAARIDTLTRTEAFYAELLRLLYRDATLLLLDEPFARLHPGTHDAFHATLRQLAQQGKTILFTSTAPDSALQSADVIVVLQKGELVRSGNAQQSTASSLYHSMTGYAHPPTLEDSPATLGAVVLSTRHLSAPPVLHDITLDVRRGELLALVGLPESGQETLARILLGQQPFTEGQLFIGSDELTTPDQELSRQSGVTYLPPITQMNTLSDHLTVAENLALRSYRGLARGGWLSGNALSDHARQLLHTHQINTTPEARVRDLSPIIKHQLLLARATAEDYQLLVALYPTHELSIEHALNLRRHLLAERARGKAILLLTDDPYEAQQLADRVAILQRGHMVATIERHTPAFTTLPALIADSNHP